MGVLACREMCMRVQEGRSSRRACVWCVRVRVGSQEGGKTEQQGSGAGARGTWRACYRTTCPNEGCVPRCVLYPLPLSSLLWSLLFAVDV